MPRFKPERDHGLLLADAEVMMNVATWPPTFSPTRMTFLPLAFARLFPGVASPDPDEQDEEEDDEDDDEDDDDDEDEDEDDPEGADEPTAKIPYSVPR